MAETLQARYRNPPLDFAPMVMWMWVGEVTPDLVADQLTRMNRDGICRALIYPFTGLRSPRYLSEEYFDCIRAALETARRLGMQLGLNHELAWPAGEARDYWMPYAPSRVLHERPEARLKRLPYTEEIVRGPS